VAELSVHFSEDAITFADGGQLLGRLKKTSVDPRGLEGFVKVNYTMQGTVAYQTFLQGVVAGLSLAFGPAGEARTDLEEASPTDELTGDGSGETIPELLPGEIVVPGHTVRDFMPVQSIDSGGVAAVPIVGDETGGLTPPRSPEAAVSETIVPSGETIVPVSELPAGELGGLTPPRSPESDPAGAASP
jgi:hypothetical protein